MSAPAAIDERGTAWMELYEEAWRERDLDRLLSPLVPECSIKYPPLPDATDTAGLRAFYEFCWSLMPDMYIAPQTWAQKGDDILIEWRGQATLQDERLEWEGCDRFTFRSDGRIVEARAYWDPRHVLTRVTEKTGVTL